MGTKFTLQIHIMFSSFHKDVRPPHLYTWGLNLRETNVTH
nr:MAG TPA: delta endotoxin [Caudoviricetes sp.]